MANVGEFFPQQFALGILNLQQTQRQEAAKLQQLRESEALRAQLEQQQQRLQAFQAQTGRMAEINAEGRAEAQNTLAEKRLDFEIRQHEDLLKNQDAAAMANLGAGRSAFIRDGAAQPPPEMLEGPSITEASGTTRPAFKFASVKVPGGTFYHVIEDAQLQQKYQKEVLENNKLVSEDIYRQAAAKNQLARAQSFQDGVKNLLQTGRITTQDGEEARKNLDAVRQIGEARLKAEQDKVKYGSLKAGDEEVTLRDGYKMTRNELIATLAANPYFDLDDSTKRQYERNAQIAEAVELLKLGIYKNGGYGTAAASVTGLSPADLESKADKARALFGHTLEGGAQVPQLQPFPTAESVGGKISSRGTPQALRSGARISTRGSPEYEANFNKGPVENLGILRPAPTRAELEGGSAELTAIEKEAENLLKQPPSPDRQKRLAALRARRRALAGQTP